MGTSPHKAVTEGEGGISDSTWAEVCAEGELATPRPRSGNRLARDTEVTSRPPGHMNAEVIPLRRRRPTPPHCPVETRSPAPEPDADESAPQPRRRKRRRTGKRLILATVPVSGMKRTQDGRGLVFESGEPPTGEAEPSL